MKLDLQYFAGGHSVTLYKDAGVTTFTASADSDVQKKSGIWEYVLDGDERHLGIRAFDDNTRLEAYERQHGICPLCGAHFELAQMEADHITPWRDGGRTVPANCQMLCKECNRRKGAN